MQYQYKSIYAHSIEEAIKFLEKETNEEVKDLKKHPAKMYLHDWELCTALQLHTGKREYIFQRDMWVKLSIDKSREKKSLNNILKESQ